MTELVMVIIRSQNIDYLKELLAQGYKVSFSHNNGYALINRSGNLFTKMFLIFNKEV